MKFFKDVRVTREVYDKDNIRPIADIGDVGTFVGYSDKTETVCMVRFNGKIKLIPKSKLKEID